MALYYQTRKKLNLIINIFFSIGENALKIPLAKISRQNVTKCSSTACSITSKRTDTKPAIFPKNYSEQLYADGIRTYKIFPDPGN